MKEAGRGFKIAAVRLVSRDNRRAVGRIREAAGPWLTVVWNRYRGGDRQGQSERAVLVLDGVSWDVKLALLDGAL